jgi:transposase
MMKHTDDFKREAVRIALNSGLSRPPVASDLGVGLSTLWNWVSMFRPADLAAAPQADLARENERLRLENRLLKDERDTLRRLPTSSRASGREDCVRGDLTTSLAGREDVSGDAGQCTWLPILAIAAGEPAHAQRHESAGPYSRARQPEP